MDKAGAVFAWVKTDVFDQRGGVVNRGGSGDPGDDFGLWLVRGQVGAWFNYPDNRRPINSRGSITAGQWALIGVAWDEKSAVLFIDGKEDSTHPLTPTELPQRRNRTMSVGSNPPGVHDPYLGLVGSVMVYNRPLSPAEAMQLYMGMRPRFQGN
jgi:hypothetical protein